MHLKTLTLKGFKSFAETTSLDLEPGVTVVVGPNGSGKSNLVDAVAWVLGAQGPSTVRSSKMEDVIFAGSAKRPALGRAEVSLTIDNTSGMIPIELTEVTITRTLWRSGDSEYAINGVPCRLLDIQELLSDSGVGRTQHVIVGQGQLDAVLNASPLDRRAVVEEAAGVLKFRRRKEKAERRLEATEANLVRLTDLLREVRRTLRPLERQAEAARRHQELAGELRALKLHLAGRELTALRRRIAAAADAGARVTEEDEVVRAELARLDAAVAAAESEVSVGGTVDHGEVLLAAERVRERARGLAALLAERRRGVERERAAALDAAVVATLEADAAHLADELAAADAEAEALAPEAQLVQVAESALDVERAATGGDTAPDGAAADAAADAGVGVRAAEARSAIAGLRTAVERGEAESARLETRLVAVGERCERLAADLEGATLARGLAAQVAADLATAAEIASTDVGTAEERAAEIAAAVRSASAERSAWAGRAEALAQALAEAEATAGLDRLAAADGALGTMAALIEVDPGWEPAVEAVLGAALATVVVEGGPEPAAAALAALAADGARGAVLPAGMARPRRPAPTGGETVRPHVRSATPAVTALLDDLLAGAVRVGGWRDAVAVAGANPGAVVVTADGDRFGPDGWRLGAAAGGVGASGAALEEARRGVDAATTAEAEAEHNAAVADDALRAARRAEASASARAADGRADRQRAEETVVRLAGEAAALAAEAEGLAGERAALDAEAGAERAELAALEAGLPALEAAEAAEAHAEAERRSARFRLEQRAAAVATQRADLEARSRSLDERRAYLQRRRAEVEERLAGSAAARAEAEARRVELDRRLLVLDRLGGEVEARTRDADELLGAVRERRRLQSEATRAAAGRLEEVRAERQAAERRLEELRERARRGELEAQEAALREEAAADALRRDLDVEPEEAMASPAPELPEGVSAAGRARELDRELRLLGPINPLALEELTELTERAGFLESQLDDVRASRRELAKVIHAVDEEIVRLFAAAFADVRENFSSLFATLFPGGEGSLRLTEPDNPLTTGIDVEARPSGKNVRKLSLLSGGERSLTALAFLFAVFRSRPSPFYLLDEVEAALDDVNLARFLELLDEFRQEAQLVVVSHQKRTMEVADILYGVSMQPGSPSRVVSERATASV